MITYISLPLLVENLARLHQCPLIGAHEDLGVDVGCSLQQQRIVLGYHTQRNEVGFDGDLDPPHRDAVDYQSIRKDYLHLVEPSAHPPILACGVSFGSTCTPYSH